MTAEALRASAGRAIARCREISAFTEVAGETTRPFLCGSAREVQTLLQGWMERAGMSVRLDAAGNIRGVYAGTGERGSRLLIGSHLDTVPNAGAFDGILGVVLGVAAVEELRGERLPFAIEVIGFSEEEGVRFSRPFLGSMALTGRLDEQILELRDGDGVSVREALGGFGLEPSGLGAAVADADAMGFLEVHIEQGPVLESAGRGLGVVEAIAGQTRLLMTFTGRSNHAGTTLMALRQDPVGAAAEWMVEVEARARRTPGLVATVGRLEARPGAANVIAGEVTASLDVRHAEDEVRAEAVGSLMDFARGAGSRRGVAVTAVTTMEQAAVPMSPGMVEALERAAARAGYAAERMTSGAGHDAMVLAERMPAAMLFVRSPGGVSHHPEERVLVEDVEAAIETLMEFLTSLRDAGTERAMTIHRLAATHA